MWLMWDVEVVDVEVVVVVVVVVGCGGGRCGSGRCVTVVGGVAVVGGCSRCS